MKTALIACEYNPFHISHEYMLNKLRRDFGVTHIICAMSGAFTQRGECAVFDKYTRAKAAVCAGADLVISLPFVYSAQNAQTFATGAVFSAMLAGADYLAFGCENDSLSLLNEAVEISFSEPFETLMRDAKASNEPYPQKRIEALSELSGRDFSFLREPNNILAFEYLRALAEKTNNVIKPLAVKRIGANHDAVSPKDGCASATYIRKLLFEGNFEEAEKYLPSECGMNAQVLSRTKLFSTDDLTEAFKTVLLLTPSEKLFEICDMQDGMQNLFKANLSLLKGNTEAFEKQVSGKRISLSRVRRCLIDALLSYTKNDNGNVRKTPPSYIRLLAANDNGRQLLNEIKKRGTHVVTKLADSYPLLSERDRHIIDFDIAAEDVVRIKQGTVGCDYLYTPFIL